MADTYLTLAAPAEAQLTEKRSRFIAYARPVSNEAEVVGALEALGREHHTARHICYAYALHTAGDVPLVRASDNGEPSGTAGRQILSQIESRGLSDTLVAVVRYFGGVKLGTGPLAVAYRTAAALALDESPTLERVITATIRLSATYEGIDTVMRIAREMGARLSTPDYTASGADLYLTIRRGDLETLRTRLTDYALQRFVTIREPAET